MRIRRINLAFIFTLSAVVFFACTRPTAILPTETLAFPTPYFGMNKPVEGDGWRITILSAENKGAEFERAGSHIKTEVSNSYLLYVVIKLENSNGAPVELAYLNTEIVVRDNAGKIYPWWLAGPAPAVYFDSTMDTNTNPIIMVESSAVTSDYIFIIPVNITVVDLLWPALPSIRLEVK